VLVVTGEVDQLTPRADMEALARGLPSARWEIVAGAGHYSFLEAPEAVERILLSFLGNIRV
jgi:pimeloyl-ACP methyl ester carboxylesterase